MFLMFIRPQVERDELILKIESSRSGKPWSEIDSSDKIQVFVVFHGLPCTVKNWCLTFLTVSKHLYNVFAGC